MDAEYLKDWSDIEYIKNEWNSPTFKTIRETYRYIKEHEKEMKEEISELLKKRK